MNFKRNIAIVAAMIMFAGTFAGAGSIGAMAATTTTEKEARVIALEDAGLKSSEVTFERTEKGTEHGASVYEIEFRTSSKEYDYDISIADGEIVSKGWELRVNKASGDQISSEKAREIALKFANVKAADATFTECKSGYEDGVAVFEIEFETQTTEYDCDVAKAGGRLQNYSETVKVPACVAAAEKKAAVSSATGKTGREAAIDAALDHAGFSRSQVSGLKCEKDYDDGREVYEVEFKKGGYEYNYDIDVNTYRVLEWDKDYDD